MRKGCAGRLELALLPQFLAIEPHFVREGCAGQLANRSFWRSNLISCERVAPDKLNSHFYLSFWRSNLISCERVAPDDLQIAILRQFLAIEPHFVRKGCAGQVEFALLPQFLAIEPHFVRRVAPDDLQIAILRQFSAIDFVRKGCVSCRLVGTAPALAFKREIEKKERARGQDGKRRGREMRRCEKM